MDWGPIILSLKLAFVTTIILGIICVPLAYWLAFTKTKLKPILETLISMPLVLPPTVLGFYLISQAAVFLDHLEHGNRFDRIHQSNFLRRANYDGAG